MNTFETNQMLCIIEAIKSLDHVVCKRSAVFTKALVMGIPEKPGALMVSQQEVKEHKGEFTFLVHYFPHHDPKKVADGQVCFSFAKSKTIPDWIKLIEFIEKMRENFFPFTEEFLYKEFNNQKVIITLLLTKGVGCNNIFLFYRVCKKSQQHILTMNNNVHFSFIRILP